MGSFTEITTDQEILFFDGECKFCNATVQFILKHEQDQEINFAPLQSDLAKEVFKNRDISADSLSTIYLLKSNQLFSKSTAVFILLKHLKYPWRIFRIFRIIPSPISDLFYDLFARYRYRLFGRQQSCMIPTPDVQKRFLDSI